MRWPRKVICRKKKKYHLITSRVTSAKPLVAVRAECVDPRRLNIHGKYREGLRDVYDEQRPKLSTEFPEDLKRQAPAVQKGDLAHRKAATRTTL